MSRFFLLSLASLILTELLWRVYPLANNQKNEQTKLLILWRCRNLKKKFRPSSAILIRSRYLRVTSIGRKPALHPIFWFFENCINYVLPFVKLDYGGAPSPWTFVDCTLLSNTQQTVTKFTNRFQCYFAKQGIYQRPNIKMRALVSVLMWQQKRYVMSRGEVGTGLSLCECHHHTW